MATYEENYGPSGINRRNDYNETDILQNMALDAAGLAEGSTGAGYVKTANAIDYLIDGLLYTMSATDNHWDLSGSGADFSTVASDEYCFVILCLDSSGTAEAYKGPVADSYAQAHLPVPPDASSVVGYLKINDINFGTDSISSGDHIDGYDLSQ